MNFDCTSSEDEIEEQKGEHNQKQQSQVSGQYQHQKNETIQDMSTIIKNDQSLMSESELSTFLNQTSFNNNLKLKNEDITAFLDEMKYSQQDSKIKNDLKMKEINPVIPEADESSQISIDSNVKSISIEKTESSSINSQLDQDGINMNSLDKEGLNLKQRNSKELSISISSQIRDGDQKQNSIENNERPTLNYEKNKNLPQRFVDVLETDRYSNKEKEQTLINKIGERDVILNNNQQQNITNHSIKESINLQNTINNNIQNLFNLNQSLSSIKSQIYQKDDTELKNQQQLVGVEQQQIIDPIMNQTMIVPEEQNTINQSSRIFVSDIDNQVQNQEQELNQSNIIQVDSSTIYKNYKELYQDNTYNNQQNEGQINQKQQDRNRILQNEQQQQQEQQILMNKSEIKKVEGSSFNNDNLYILNNISYYNQDKMIQEQEYKYQTPYNHQEMQSVQLNQNFHILEQNQRVGQIDNELNEPKRKRNIQIKMVDDQESEDQEENKNNVNGMNIQPEQQSKIFCSNSESLSEIKGNQSEFNFQDILDEIQFQIQPDQIKENKLFSQALEQDKLLSQVIKQMQWKKKEFIKIEPRDYQQEIFDNSRDGNYIIYLETGTGKTLVSLMIAYYTLQKYKDSKVVFLANQVNLVEQQYKAYLTYLRGIEEYFIKENKFPITRSAEDINISFFHGKMNVDFWNRQFWQKNIESSQILFFSTQVYLNGLRRGYYNLSQFKMMIFDECHNASKEHPFSQIMKEFYFESLKKNIVLGDTPFIIGLSATPITQGNSKNIDVVKEMLRLAKQLDCSFGKYDTKKVEEQLANTKETQQYYQVDLDEEDYQYIEANNIKGFENVYIVLKKLNDQYPELKNLFQKLEVIHIEQMNQLPIYSRQILNKITTLLDQHLIILIYQIGSYELKNTNQKNEEVNYIDRLYPQDFEKIQQNAIQEAQILKNEDNFFNIKFFDIKQKYTEQLLTIKRFKNQDFRILVSTSVAEEGFDIPNCTSVIAFSRIVSQRQFIQMKGRARAKESKFYVFYPLCLNQSRPNQDHQKTSDQIKQAYQKLSLLSKQEIKVLQDKVLQDDVDKSMMTYEKFIVEETNANVNTFWSKDIVNMFCQSYTSLNILTIGFPYMHNILINSENKYLCLVILPFSIKGNINSNILKLQNQKDDAQRHACLQVVKSLLDNNYLSKELRPRLKTNKGFYFGRGEDDFYIQYSKKYNKIIQKHRQEIFISYLNGKKRQIVVYKKLYNQIVDQVFHRIQPEGQEDSLVSNKYKFYQFNVQIKGQKLSLKLLYDQNTLGDFLHQEIKFVYENTIEFTLEELTKIRKINEEIHLFLLNIKEYCGSYKKIYDVQQLIYSKTKNQVYSQSKESICLNQNVVFLYWNQAIFNQTDQINQICKEFYSINSYIDQVRDHLKLKIITEIILNKIETNKKDLQEQKIYTSYAKIIPNIILTEELTNNEDQVQKGEVNFEYQNIKTPSQQELIKIFQQQNYDKKVIFLGKQYFKFIASLLVLDDHQKMNYEVMINELQMKFNNSYVMSKAVECKLFKYLNTKEYITLAPCLRIISTKIHTYISDQEKLRDKVQNQSYKQNVQNYNMSEIKNIQFTNFIYYVIGHIMLQNKQILKEYKNQSILFQSILKSFGLIDRFVGEVQFIQPQQEFRYNDIQDLLNLSEKLLKYNFKNIGLLQQALTHSSFREDIILQNISIEEFMKQQENKQNKKEILKYVKQSQQFEIIDISNDRLSFLGQMIYQQMILYLLYDKYSDKYSDDLDIFMELLCNHSIKSKICSQLYLEQYFQYGQSQEKYFQGLKQTSQVLRKNNIFTIDIATFYQHHPHKLILSQLFDSLVGAIYIDQGQKFEQTQSYFLQYIQYYIDNIVQLSNQYPKYILKKILTQKGYDWDEIQIIKVPHPEGYKPQNIGKYNYQLYYTKTEELVLDKVFEKLNMNEVYLELILMRDQIKNEKDNHDY